MSYYIGTSPTDVIGSFIKRYFYGMRRNDDGELFLIVADQLAGNQDSVTINELGIAEDNFLDFEEGIDFLSLLGLNLPPRRFFPFKFIICEAKSLAP